MSRVELKALLELLMCADPYPGSEENRDILIGWVNKEVKIYGFDNWIDAYHSDWF